MIADALACVSVQRDVGKVQDAAAANKPDRAEGGVPRHCPEIGQTAGCGGTSHPGG